MGRLAQAVVALTLVGCWPIHKPPVPKLADVGTVDISAHFLGVQYDRDSLYVCGTMSSEFSCIPYGTFERTLQEQR